MFKYTRYFSMIGAASGMFDLGYQKGYLNKISIYFNKISTIFTPIFIGGFIGYATDMSIKLSQTPFSNIKLFFKTTHPFFACMLSVPFICMCASQYNKYQWRKKVSN